jgi:hypothetical protein
MNLCIKIFFSRQLLYQPSFYCRLTDDILWSFWMQFKDYVHREIMGRVIFWAKIVQNFESLDVWLSRPQSIQSGNGLFYGVHSITMEKSAHDGEGGDARPPPFTISTITHTKVWCMLQPEKRYSIEHRAGWLAGGKWPSRASFVGDGSFRGFTCLRIFPGMKPWTAWVHFYHKYSTYRHELNYAQMAGASEVWLQLRGQIPPPISTLPLYVFCGLSIDISLLSSPGGGGRGLYTRGQ